MHVESKNTAPELELYIALLVVIYLHDHNEFKKGAALTVILVGKSQTFNRRTLDHISARLFFYLARFHELTGEYDTLRPYSFLI